jgi:AcrR family transcriptional regulator
MHVESAEGTVADQDTSKDRILDALLQLMSTKGAEGLTIRKVAAAAGVSVGAVQHHFATKEALLVAGMNIVNDRFRDRVMPMLHEAATPEDRLRIFCREIASIERGGLTDAIVWTVFAARASTDPHIRSIHSRDWATTESVMLRLLADAYPDSDVTADDAALLLAVTDGIAVARAAEQSERMSPARATKLIDQVLQGIAARAT